jgi:hypothetical protein
MQVKALRDQLLASPPPPPPPPANLQPAPAADKDDGAKRRLDTDPANRKAALDGERQKRLPVGTLEQVAPCFFLWVSVTGSDGYVYKKEVLLIKLC